jgi:hypothetical protein
MTPFDDRGPKQPSCIWFLFLCVLSVLLAGGLAITTGDVLLASTLAFYWLVLGVGIILIRRAGQ